MSATDRIREFFTSPTADVAFGWVLVAWCLIAVGYIGGKVVSWWFVDKAEPLLCERCFDLIHDAPVIGRAPDGSPTIVCSEACRDAA